MRTPNLENYSNDKKIQTVRVSGDTVEMKTVPGSDRDKVKTIKEIERLVRGSLEYRDYIKFLKQNIDMNMCSFFVGVSRKNGEKVKIEIHHEPFTLFDISQIVLEKHIDQSPYAVNTFVIAEEVAKLHYQGSVGLIPISKTIHDLVHDGKLFIPLQNLYGFYIRFIEDYEPYIPNDILAMLETKLAMSQDIESQDMSILETKYTYLDVEGMTFPQIIE